MQGWWYGKRHTCALITLTLTHIHCYPPHHPTKPKTKTDLAAYPRFANMSALEFVLQPGELLFVPSFWLHAIVHLVPSLQCNAFSHAVSVRGREAMAACGFDMGDAEEGEDEEEWPPEEEEQEDRGEL